MAWIPLQYAGRLIPGGRPLPASAAILSAEAIAGGLQVSLMERLMDLLGPQISRRLDVQYRMHQRIMAFSSAEFYAGSLVAHPSVRDHLLRDLPVIIDNDLTATPIDFIDTAGASYDEAVEPEGDSRFNPLEAELVLKKVQALLDAGLAPDRLAVITPYSAQVRLLRERLKQTEIEIDSVDGGGRLSRREKEAVIHRWSVPPAGEIGFLETCAALPWSHPRRRKLIVHRRQRPSHRSSLSSDWSLFRRDSEAYHSVWEEYKYLSDYYFVCVFVDCRSTKNTTKIIFGYVLSLFIGWVPAVLLLGPIHNRNVLFGPWTQFYLQPGLPLPGPDQLRWGCL